MRNLTILIAFLMAFAVSFSQKDKVSLNDTSIQKIWSETGNSYTLDSLFLTKLNCGLYKDQRAIIYFKYRYRYEDPPLVKIDEDVYEQKIFNVFDKAKYWEETIDSMKNVVDTSTFQILNAYAFKDKNNVYVLHWTSDGVKIILRKKINPSNFIVYEDSEYGTDGKNIYFRGEKIKNAQVKSFSLQHGSYLDEFYDAKDKKRYYFYGEEIVEK